ncbi:hypothetical protein Tco_0365725 [Tanacetum coccineum]
MNEDKVKKDIEEIETINIELDHKVSKLIAENEHLKQTYKQLYDSIKPTRIKSKEQCDALVNQVNQKSMEISDLNASLQEKVLVITALKHDFCVVQHLSKMNDRARAKAVKSIKMKEWKPTGKMFKNVRYKWVPTGRTFTIVGTKCPLTRFTSTKIVPPRKPIKSTVITNIKPSSASQWRPKEINHTSSSSAPKIIESRTANHLEPNNHIGSNVSISTCSSSVQCKSYKSYLGNWIRAALHI